MLMSAELKGCATWFIYFLDLLWVRYNCVKFHHCRICVTDFKEGGLFGPYPIHEQPRKSPSWLGLRHTLLQIYDNLWIYFSSDKKVYQRFFIWKIVFLFEICAYGKIEKVFNLFVKVTYCLRKSITLCTLEYLFNNKTHPSHS